MASQSPFHYFYRLLCLSVLTAIAYSCGSDEPDAGTEPVTDTVKNVDFTMDIPAHQGEGTPSSPITVGNDAPTEIVFRQKSSYTNPDKTTYTCEPIAKVSIKATLDTVFAKDIAALREVISNETKTSTSNLNSTAKETSNKQKINIGGQNIEIDLLHEIYTYVNSQGQSIEMPYLRLSPVKVGGSTATESSRSGSIPVSTFVTVTPAVSMSRGITLRDSTLYNVNVRLSINAETMNVTSSSTKTIEFSLDYIGVVETVTELADPVSDLTYEFLAKSGTDSFGSPFVMSGSKDMEIWLSQKSSYTDEYSNRVSCEPTAKVKLSLAKDTVWTQTLDDLKVFKSLESNDNEQSTIQKFGSDLQSVTAEWSYDTASGQLGGELVDMPYYALQPLVFDNISVKELGDQTIGGKMATLYEVSATFQQKATAQNITKENITIEYTVKYIGAVELKVVNVEYYPGGEWRDPHDNMALAYYAHVDRYLTFSNGKRLVQRFVDNGHPVQLGTSTATPDTYKYGDDGDYMILYPETDTVIGDSIRYYTRSFEFYSHDNAYEFSYQLGRNLITTPTPLYDWDNYGWSKLYSAEDEKLLGVYNDSNKTDLRQMGWYYCYFIHTLEYNLLWNDILFTNIAADFKFYDQLLVIDGKRVDFKDLHAFNDTHTITEQPLTTPDKIGKIIRLERHTSYLGKTFLQVRVDSLYHRP